MRGLKLAGLAVALVASSSANAATWLATLKGTVTEQFATFLTTAGATSPIKVGDTISATFRVTDNASVGESLSGRFGMFGINKATFSLAGYSWSSDDDFLADLSPPQLTGGADPLRDYFSTMSSRQGGGDLRLRRYSFEIGEFGYGAPYRGPGFRGTFDPTSYSVAREDSVAALAAVPETALWLQLIAGFAIVGTAIRQRQKRRAQWLGLVARLSGRVREA
jgi:hypothetical protein